MTTYMVSPIYHVLKPKTGSTYKSVMNGPTPWGCIIAGPTVLEGGGVRSNLKRKHALSCKVTGLSSHTLREFFL